MPYRVIAYILIPPMRYRTLIKKWSKDVLIFKEILKGSDTKLSIVRMFTGGFASIPSTVNYLLF